MPCTGCANPEGNGVNSVVFPNAYRQQWDAGNTLQHMSAERWYLLSRKMNDLSDKVELMKVVVGSMERSFDSLCARFDDLETVMSLASVQLSIASLQLDMAILNHRYRPRHPSTELLNGSTGAIPKTKADVRKRSGASTSQSTQPPRPSTSSFKRKAQSPLVSLEFWKHEPQSTPLPRSEYSFSLNSKSITENPHNTSIEQQFIIHIEDLLDKLRSSQLDQLVVEDSERAAKAAEGTDRKEATLLNGNAHRVGVTSHTNTLSQSTFRSRFTIPRVPSTYGSHTEPASATRCSGDTVDTIVIAPKTKLKSFQERKDPYRQEYYHDARFLQSEVSLGSSSEPVEKDDEGDRHDDNVNPLLNDMKEKSSMYVHLPQKPQCTDLPPSLQDPLVDQYTNQLTNEFPGKDKKQSNNNKDPEDEVESSCALDCLYYTLQCCDCSIM